MLVILKKIEDIPNSTIKETQFFDGVTEYELAEIDGRYGILLPDMNLMVLPQNTILEFIDDKLPIRKLIIEGFKSK